MVNSPHYLQKGHTVESSSGSTDMVSEINQRPVSKKKKDVNETIDPEAPMFRRYLSPSRKFLEENTQKGHFEYCVTADLSEDKC